MQNAKQHRHRQEKAGKYLGVLIYAGSHMCGSEKAKAGACLGGKVRGIQLEFSSRQAGRKAGTWFTR